jgi:hypothetical protein
VVVGVGGGGLSGGPGVPAESEGGFRMFVAGRMVLQLFVESHGTLVAVSVPLVMPLRDSDIPMNVPIAFRNTQPFPPPPPQRPLSDPMPPKLYGRGSSGVILETEARPEATGKELVLHRSTCDGVQEEDFRPGSCASRQGCLVPVYLSLQKQNRSSGQDDNEDAITEADTSTFGGASMWHQAGHTASYVC